MLLQPFCNEEACRMETMRQLSNTNLQQCENSFSHSCKLVLLIIGNQWFPIPLHHGRKPSVLLFFCLKKKKNKSLAVERFFGSQTLTLCYSRLKSAVTRNRRFEVSTTSVAESNSKQCSKGQQCAKRACYCFNPPRPKGHSPLKSGRV